MPQYVDGFIIPVPKKNLDAYRRMAQKAGKIWREHGALEVLECVADDVKVGKLTSFPRSVKKKADETVIFSWILYKSRADRDSNTCGGRISGSVFDTSGTSMSCAAVSRRAPSWERITRSA